MDRNTLSNLLDLFVWLKSLVGWSQDWMETELQSGLKSSSGSLWCNKAISLLLGAGHLDSEEKEEQGNYSLRRPPKLIIQQIFIKQI